MIKVARLQISGIRGLPADWPPINVRERGLVLYGPNGSGKSSIVDGIEYALKGSSTLFADNRMGVNWEKASPHVKGGQRQAEVICEESGTEYNINRANVLPETVNNWKLTAGEANFVLRRHMLLRFIASQPAFRYEQLEPFFDVAVFASYEENLRSLANTLATEVSQRELEVAREAQKLRLHLELEPTAELTLATVDKTLAKALKDCGLSPELTDDALKARAEEVTAELRGFAANARLNLLSALRQRFHELLPTSTFEIMLGQLADAQANLLKAEAERSESIAADFLRTGRAFIESTESELCPLCESKIAVEAVLERLSTRIASDEKYISARNAFVELSGEVAKPISVHLTNLQSAVSGWNKAFGEELPEAYASEIKLLTKLLECLRTKKPIEDLGDIIAGVKASISSHKPRIDQIDDALSEGGGERRAKLNKLLSLIGIRRTEFSVFEKQLAELARMRARLKVAERVHGHAVQARKATVQQVVERLAQLANEYYEFIHPGEGIAKSSLDVRNAGSGSIDIRTEFCGSIEHPLLHLSESHLDTLGLCFFLAARRLETVRWPEFKLLVLDDVVHSVDAEHRDRVARLLAEKFSDHQMVVVTHDSVFYQRLRHYLGDKFEYVYFSSWSIEGGPVRTTSSTDVDRVTQKDIRDSLTVDQLAASCGRFLEFLLRVITERLNVPIPARFTRPHDIGNMWPSLYSKIKKAKNAPDSLKELAERINDNQWIRNQVGAHYNEPEVPVTHKEVVQLAEALTDFYDLVFCRTCRVAIGKHADDDWRCGCEALKYQKAA